MTKNAAPTAAPMTELSLDALDVVIGGNSAAPMGLGGSLAAPMPALTIGAHTASTGHGSSPTGYNDHFGLHFGGPASTTENASNTSSHSSTQSQSQSQNDSHMPMGLGGSMPAGAPVNGGSSGAQSTDAGHAGSDAGHPASGQQDVSHGDPFGAPAPISGSAGAQDHDPSGHEQLGVNAASAFQLLDEAAQDAGHEVSPEALADSHS